MAGQGRGGQSQRPTRSNAQQLTRSQLIAQKLAGNKVNTGGGKGAGKGNTGARGGNTRNNRGNNRGNNGGNNGGNGGNAGGTTGVKKPHRFKPGTVALR